jgi:hypothetical protein
VDREVLAVVLEALEDAIEECAYAEEISGALDRKLERAYALLKEEMDHEQ